jgi:hypothetical protein
VIRDRNRSPVRARRYSPGAGAGAERGRDAAAFAEDFPEPTPEQRVELERLILAAIAGNYRRPARPAAGGCQGDAGGVSPTPTGQPG